jgi:hypothetical protein
MEKTDKDFKGLDYYSERASRRDDIKTIAIVVVVWVLLALILIWVFG